MKFPFFNFSKKEYPEFWKNYCAHFNSKKQRTIDNTRFVVFDTETTGFDFKEDRILCIGCTTVKQNKIIIKDGLEIYLNQDVFKADTVKIHGILKTEKVTKLEEKEALIVFLDYIKDSVLVAHHAGFDIGIVNQALKRHKLGRLKNDVLDTGILFKRSKHIVNIIDPNKKYSLDEIAQELKITPKDRHTAAGDAFITALVFLKILPRLNKDGKMKYKDLFINPMNY
ncbi:3'-5' exonuclease [Flavicella marina]|uniref:3'-5' exonuclease n=1 Tax=Flavicella marina TaxID=1475951 RepID=UPI001264ACF3|nr:3'-5' exonuclease [Flavicella marina]